jgi:hypothetical protein
MLMSLLLLVSHGQAVPPAADPVAHRDPPVHVWFNSDGDFSYHDRAKVYAKSADDGYLVVLRSDMDGHVRVLFPIDPQDDQRVSADKKYELKGRGGREAFVTEDTTGQGIVLAAYSEAPFSFARFEKDGLWDYGALSGQNQATGHDDPEAQLLSVVHEMQSPGRHFDYDVATYVVSAPRYAHLYPYPYAGWWGYDPWWGYGPAFGSRFWFGPRHFGFGLTGRR